MNNDVDFNIKELLGLKIESLDDVYKYYNELQNNDSRDNILGVKKYDDNRIKDAEKLKCYEKINSELNDNSNVSNITVFLSHCHDDLKYAYCVACFLKNTYNVNVYIDAFDSSMPSTTNAETADRLIKRIKKSDRFIFVGTKNSFESRWCNWELGLSDSKSLNGHLAFWVMSDQNAKNGDFDENEYVSLYPFIWDKKIRGIESNDNDLYVGYHDLDNKTFVKLKDWLQGKKNFRHANTSLGNRNISLVAFFLSSFKIQAANALGFGTISKALVKMSSVLGKSLKQCYCEFNLFFKREQDSFNKFLPSRIALRCFNEWKEKTFDDLKNDVFRIIEDCEKTRHDDLSRN